MVEVSATLKENPTEFISHEVKAIRETTKSQLCYHYRSSYCILKATECDFAHGTEDLHLPLLKQRLDEEYKLLPTLKNKTDIEARIKAIESTKIRQVYGDEMDLTERFLFFQHEFRRLGYTDRVFTKEDLLLDEAATRPLKKRLCINLSKKYMELLFDHFNTHFLDKTLVELCFRQISWKANYTYFVDSEFAFEARDKSKRTHIVRLPKKEEFELKVEKGVALIIKKNNLLDEIPISPSKISKYYYVDVCKDWHEPTLAHFLKLYQKDLDNYLAALNENDRFISLLSSELGLEKEKLKSMQLFDSSTNEGFQIEKIMVSVLQDFEKNSKYGITTLEALEVKAFSELHKVFPNLKSNLAPMKTRLKDLCLKHNVLIMNLLPGSFLIFGNRLRAQEGKELLIDHPELKEITKPKAPNGESSKDGEIIMVEETKQVNKLPEEPYTVKIKQFPRNTNAAYENLLRIYMMPSLENCKLIIPEDRFSESELQEFLDPTKLVVVDDAATLEIFELTVVEMDAVGIDIEGALRLEGYVELIQISVGDLIFVFDFFGVQSKAVHSQDAVSEQLYYQMVKAIQNVMHNEKICKIFHDGRRDSIALRAFLDALPVNNYDTSAAWKFNKHLSVYSQYKEFFRSPPSKEKQLAMNNLNAKHCAKIYSEIEGIQDPGLNLVLKDYEASHGANPLKEIMKKRMHTLPRDYFLRRPIDQENLIYAAKDVEDLVEVKEKSFKHTIALFEELLGPVDREKVYKVISFISDCYEQGDPDI